MRSPVWLLLATTVASVLSALPCSASETSLWSRENLVAWCIVPFDAKKRGPVERAEMLQRLGLKRLAYDFRDEHIPTFDAEVKAMQEHGIEIVAWWFPTTLNKTAETILDVVRRHNLRLQLWVTGWNQPWYAEATPERILEHEVARIRTLADAANNVGCTVALYNHGGWFGQPEHQVAIIEALRVQGVRNVGIVYNFHHAHEDVARFAELWTRMQPHVVAVNLNGMVRDGERRGQKIVRLGQGDHEREMMQIIQRSGWRGPVGVLDHLPELDSEIVLRENLAGLAELAKQLRPPSAR